MKTRNQFREKDATTNEQRDGHAERQVKKIPVSREEIKEETEAARISPLTRRGYPKSIRHIDPPVGGEISPFGMIPAWDSSLTLRMTQNFDF
jgi:hypothetical protein